MIDEYRSQEGLINELVRLRQRVDELEAINRRYSNVNQKIVMLEELVRDLKITEEALRRSEQEKSDILESISDAFFTLDRNFHFTFTNHSFESLVNFSREELLGQNFQDMFPGANALTLNQLHKVMYDKNPQGFELYSRIVGKWLEIKIYPNRNGLSVYFTDISEQKLQDQKYQQLSTAFLENLLNYANAPIIVWDPEYKIIRFNRAQRTSPDFVRKRTSWLSRRPYFLIILRIAASAALSIQIFISLVERPITS